MTWSRATTRIFICIFLEATERAGLIGRQHFGAPYETARAPLSERLARGWSPGRGASGPAPTRWPRSASGLAPYEAPRAGTHRRDTHRSLIGKLPRPRAGVPVLRETTLWT